MELKSRQREQKTSSKPNMTGIPVQMKQDFERRSGLSFEDVRVHYNSEKPAQLGAYAYTQGTQVYVGPGQERHLRHELTHVVQQKQGLVTPTGMTGGLPVNNDPELERQAENGVVLPHVRQASHPVVVQRVPTPGKTAAIRFSQLVNENALTLEGDAISQELLRIGVPENIAQTAEDECKRVNAQPGSRCKKICIRIILRKYNRMPAVARGADYRRGLQNNTELRQILSEALKAIYSPLIEETDEGHLNANPGAIKFTIQDGSRAEGLRPAITEGVKRMNRLIAPKTQLPEVIIGDTAIGGYTVFKHNLDDPEEHGEQFYGLGTGPSQVMHEQGHHVENYLDVNQFANLHNYLYRHTDPNNPDRVSGWNSLAGITVNTPTGGAGYNIDFPEMKFQGDISRSIHSGNGLIRFFLFNLVNFFRGQEAVDNFYLQESNSRSTGYASHYKQNTYDTEFLSTTAELLSTARGAEEAIQADPTRIAMFAYLTNRELYDRANQEFIRIQRERIEQNTLPEQIEQNDRSVSLPVSLNDYLSIIGET